MHLIGFCSSHILFCRGTLTSLESQVRHCKLFRKLIRKCSTTRLSPPWRVMFFGTDEFSLPHLKALNENRLSSNRTVDTLEVVVPGSAQTCPVLEYAIKEEIVYHTWPLKTVPTTFDVGVVTSFGYLIPTRIINKFPYGILNVHPSLLPRWRGASPILHTVLNGDRLTGITIIEIRPIHFDTGPILVQESYIVPPRCTATRLMHMLSHQGAKLLMTALADLLTLERMEHEQPNEGISYAHLLSHKNTFINWKLQTAIEIDQQYRALNDKFGMRSVWKGAVIRLHGLQSADEMADVLALLAVQFPEGQVCPRPGLPYFIKHAQILCIRAKDSWVGFTGVTYKKYMSALAFYNGYLSSGQNAGQVFQSRENELDKYSYRTAAAQPKLISARKAR